MSYKIIKGDVLKCADHNILIPHIVNNIGAWGAGFVKALSKKWPESEEVYSKNWKTFSLGSVQYIEVAQDITIANMFAQNKIRSEFNKKPIVYSALCDCMEKICNRNGWSYEKIRCPKFGAGLAGGNWDTIESLIKEIWSYEGIDVEVYEING